MMPTKCTYMVYFVKVSLHTVTECVFQITLIVTECRYKLEQFVYFRLHKFTMFIVTECRYMLLHFVYFRSHLQSCVSLVIVYLYCNFLSLYAVKVCTFETSCMCTIYCYSMLIWTRIVQCISRNWEVSYS